MREAILTLTAPEFHGRGYVREGDRKAGQWIQEQFAQIGLRPIGQRYIQAFRHDVWTFPEDPLLQIGKKKLRPGLDFMPDAASSGGDERLRLVHLDTGIFSDPEALRQWQQKDLSRAALCYDQRWEQAVWELEQPLRPALHLIVQENLIFSIADRPRRPPTLRLRERPQVRRVRYALHTQAQPDYESHNIMGMIEGKTQPDSVVVFTAHYDHLGGWGKVYFPGANDNASGVALLLELARHYAQHPPKYTIAFMAFAGEEAGLKGSRFYVEHPRFPLSQIKFLVNLDLTGTGKTGATVVNATAYPEAYRHLKSLNETGGYLRALQARNPAPNSDQHFFHLAGVPCFFIYLTTDRPIPYHHPEDTLDQIRLSGVRGLFRLLVDFEKNL